MTGGDVAWGGLLVQNAGGGGRDYIKLSLGITTGFREGERRYLDKLTYVVAPVPVPALQINVRLVRLVRLEATL